MIDIDEIEGHGITPISRTGGKSKLAKRLILMMPKDYEIYVEPFVGAGNVILRKPEQGLEIINDLEKDIYTILKAVRDKPEYLNKKLYGQYIDGKEEYKKLLKKNDAVSLIKIYKQSFLGRKGAYMQPDARGHLMGIKTDFVKIGDRLKNVDIYNKPFQYIIHKFDTPFTFFYLDPPYENPTESDYKHYVNPLDIYNSIKNIKGKFMLSYNNSPNIRQIFKEFYIKRISTTYSTDSGEKKVIELVITNYKI